MVVVVVVMSEGWVWPAPAWLVIDVSTAAVWPAAAGTPCHACRATAGQGKKERVSETTLKTQRIDARPPRVSLPSAHAAPLSHMASTPPTLPAGAPGDLTAALAPFLDRHLLFPLVEFLSARGAYEPASLTDAKIELLAGTNMVDYAADVWRAAHGGGDPPRELVARRDDVVARLQVLQVSV